MPKKEIIGWGDLGAIAEPLALEYIAAATRLEGHDVQILDLRLHPDLLDVTLLAYQPHMVGVTGYSMHVLRALGICGRAKELVPGVRTIAGGHHATLLPEDYFEPWMDYVVVGEGAGPFRKVLRCLEQKLEPVGIAGVWARSGGKFVWGGDQGALEIDGIPTPDRSCTTGDRENYFIDWMKPIALLRTTVGCPYRCSFCSLWRIMDGRYFKRQNDGVLQELETIKEENVFLVDDEPFVSPRRMHELAETLERARIRKQYFAYCRIDSFLRDRDLMERWRDLGLKRVFFGIETIFDNELKIYNKRQKLEDIQRGLRTAQDIGIKVFSNFIISPDYSKAQFDEVINFIDRCGVEYPSFTILTPIPGTGATFEHVIERQPNGRPNWEYFDLQHPVVPTKLPREEFMAHYQDLFRAAAPKYSDAGHPFFKPAPANNGVAGIHPAQQALADPLAARVGASR